MEGVLQISPGRPSELPSPSASSLRRDDQDRLSGCRPLPASGASRVTASPGLTGPLQKPRDLLARIVDRNRTSGVKLDRVLAHPGRDAANRRFAKHLLHERPYIFTFLDCPGLDATNNVSE